MHFAGADETYDSTWFAYKTMEFLVDRDKPRETLSTVSTNLHIFTYTSASFPPSFHFHVVRSLLALLEEREWGVSVVMFTWVMTYFLRGDFVLGSHGLRI